MKTRRCYIYTRVSTSMQVDGYSLDAQKDKLKKYAEFQDMVVAGEYSDEGKSGKNIEGRPQFLQMLKDIESGKDKVEFVLVFKLSRFGRNAADVLSSLQRMQDFGVNLICVEDGIDSSKDSGKLMISVLSAVAEIERENILVQTMEGRRQKAREGKWNGGFAPYGYKLVDGYLYIADDEVDVIRIIFDKYVNTTMGASAVATYLNEHGYVKKKRQNNTLDMFSAHFIKSILDNPVYCGKLAYGRRKNEKIAGTRNQYHIVKQDDYPVYDGVHEAIVSEEVWQMAQRKRQETGVKSEKIYNQEHENILSSILRCPVCGAAMYGNVNRKKKKDGTLYKDYYYYHCKHRTTVNGHKCGYRRQWKQEMVDAAVEEVIRKLVTNPKFEQAIRQKIGSRIDTEELETELEQLRKKLHQLNGAKAKLGQQMDSLDVTDKHYDRKYQDMEERLYKLYDDIDSVEEEIEEVETRIYNVRQQKISGDNIYQFLLYFDKLYDKFTDAEKKEFLNSFIERVDIYEQEQPDGRFLKHIKFRFPVYFNGKEIEEMSWDNETTVESKLGEGSCFTVVLPFEIDTNARPEEKEDFNADISGVRILLVEDNELNAEIAEFMLTENGAKVETVKNGLEAVQHFEACESGTYDVILMDVMMPVMDGLTATKTIRSLERQDAKTIPIIAMTANAFREDAEKCIAVGMNAHLAKPLDIEKMKKTIKSICS